MCVFACARVCAFISVCVPAWACVHVLGEGGGGGMLGRSVCLNLLLLAEKVMSASTFLKCVLFAVFSSYHPVTSYKYHQILSVKCTNKTNHCLILSNRPKINRANILK